MPCLCPGLWARLAHTAGRILLVAVARATVFTLGLIPFYLVHAHRGGALDFPAVPPASVHAAHGPRADAGERRSPHP